MDSVKVIFLAVSCLAFLQVTTASDFQKMFIQLVRCNGSEKFVYKNYSCFAKSYSRHFSTTNIILTAKVPLHDITVSFKIDVEFDFNWNSHKVPSMDSVQVRTDLSRCHPHSSSWLLWNKPSNGQERKFVEQINICNCEIC